MKRISYLFLLLVAFAACQQEETFDRATLTGKEASDLREMLKARHAEVRELETEIELLEELIEEKDPAPAVATLVSVEPITRSNFERFVEVQGTVQSDDFVGAAAEVAGRVVRLTVEEGDNVRKGQLIARLDLETLDKQIAELETSLSLASDVYQRLQRLWDQNIGSEIQLLEAKNNKERLEKSLETIRFQQTKQNVYAPISGVAEQVFVKQGELASPGMPIVQILSTRNVKVVVDVPENYLGVVKRGQMVTVSFPALNREVKAKVTQLGRQIDPNNRTFEMEIAMTNTDGTLKPNLLAEVSFNDKTVENVVVIPMSLVQQEVSGKSFVYLSVDTPEGAVARKRYVETGDTYDGQVIITDGLTGEEMLITRGARSISEGQLLEAEVVSAG